MTLTNIKRDKLAQHKGLTQTKYTGERGTGGNNEGGACNHTGGRHTRGEESETRDKVSDRQHNRHRQ